MGHNIWFVISLMVLVFVAPFGAINPLIALAAVGVAGVFFFIWYLKEMEEQEKEYKKGVDKRSPQQYNDYRKLRKEVMTYE